MRLGCETAREKGVDCGDVLGTFLSPAGEHRSSCAARRRIAAMLLSAAARSPRSLLLKYSAHLAERPIQVKTATSVAIAACGDAVVQAATVPAGEGAIDCKRTTRQASFSMLMTPVAHVWFGYLARFKPGMAVLIDQLTFAPAANVAYIGWSFAFREGGLQGCGREVKNKLWPAMKVTYLVWPAALLLNFTFVPIQFRVLFTNCVGFGYGAFMTFLANDCNAA